MRHNFSQQYEIERYKYEKQTHKVKILLEELLEQQSIKASIEARTKDISSFEEKLNRSDKFYQNPFDEITDLSGLRIILYSLDDINKVIDIIENEFEVIKEKSINKADMFDTNEFGYLSIHYIVKVKNTRKNLPEWSDINSMVSEIQVRTVLQHSWAVVSHFLDYKSTIDIPKEVRRRLFRLSALFELADEELLSIINEVKKLKAEYRVQIIEEKEDIEINLDSLRAYIESSDTIKEWSKFIETLSISIGPIGFVSRDIEMIALTGITTISQIDQMIKNSVPWGHDYLKEFFFNSWKGNHTGVSIDINGIITLLLIGNYLNVFDENTLENKFGFGEPQRATLAAKKVNPKYR